MDEIEIPEAIRENVEVIKKPRSFLSLPAIFIAILSLGLAGLLSMFLLSPNSQEAQEEVSTPAASDASKSVPPPVTKKPSGNKSSPANQSIAEDISVTPEKTKPEPVNLLGHLPYNVAPQSDLKPITADNRLQLRTAAAKKFQQMQADARADGVVLVPISAFRTTQDQEQLFFGIKEQRVQDAAKRAEVSAPPGYSEHHTGYAIDIGDGDAPATNLETSFAETAAFTWLKKNALKYSFELSFPPNNEQGVSYEPWHWRFVGDRHSLETFYKVRE